MKKRLMGVMALMTSALYVSPALSDIEKGGMLFQEHCASCHGGDTTPSERLAPPVMGIRNHYLPVYTTQTDFTAAIVRWVKAPNTNDTLMPGAIERFKLMPALDLDDEVIEDIAAFIYSGQFAVPGWYKQHYQEEHGKDPAN